MEETSSNEGLSAKVLQEQVRELLIQTISYCASIKVSPEKRLMLAVLEYAIYEFARYVGSDVRREKRLFQEARDWIFELIDKEWPCSFENICCVLNLNPDYLRLGLQKYENEKREQKTSKIAEFKDILEKVTYKKN